MGAGRKHIVGKHELCLNYGPEKIVTVVTLLRVMAGASNSSVTPPRSPGNY